MRLCLGFISGYFLDTFSSYLHAQISTLCASVNLEIALEQWRCHRGLIHLPTLVPPSPHPKGYNFLGESWEFHSLNVGLFNNKWAKQMLAPILLAKIS